MNAVVRSAPTPAVSAAEALRAHEARLEGHRAIIRGLTQQIERCARDKRFVQVLMLVMGDMPLGKRALWPIYLSQLQGAVLGAPLPLGASVLIAWPQIVGLLATTILLFVIGYVVFQRQEVRA